jgi:hypothetical protein
MTYLEIIALAIYLWNAELFKKRVLFHVDNMAVVAILNKKTSKSARALSILAKPELLLKLQVIVRKPCFI